MSASDTLIDNRVPEFSIEKGIHTYKFDVKMTCGGCSGAINRALKKAKEAGDVTDFSVSLEDQEVIVKSATLDYKGVEEKIAKTGKEIRSGTTVE